MDGATLAGMSTWFECPYLYAPVELTDERYTHISQEHADFVPYVARLEEVLRDPDAIRRSSRDARIRLFARWYDDIVRGKYVIVVVVADPPPPQRHWIATAYMANRLMGGTTEWMRS
jgi:hypothetical protein